VTSAQLSAQIKIAFGKRMLLHPSIHPSIQYTNPTIHRFSESLECAVVMTTLVCFLFLGADGDQKKLSPTPGSAVKGCDYIETNCATEMMRLLVYRKSFIFLRVNIVAADPQKSFHHLYREAIWGYDTMFASY
jgi:hypothetical protein